jgi:CPA2 family monovalent cation:H+ antiporter-2
VTAKVLADLGRLGNRETPSVLNLLVIEDLAMAAYLPVMGAVVSGSNGLAMVRTVTIALAAAVGILVVALRCGPVLSRALAGGSDEALLLSAFGLTLLVGGLAQRLQVSAAIGAFLVGLALSGPVQRRGGRARRAAAGQALRTPAPPAAGPRPPARRRHALVGQARR